MKIQTIRGMECPAQILAQEVIGYHNVSLIALDDPRVGFDPVTQFGYISSCTDSRSASEYIQGVLPNLGCQLLQLPPKCAPDTTTYAAVADTAV